MPTPKRQLNVNEWSRIVELEKDFKFFEQAALDRFDRWQDTIITMRGDIEKIMNNHLAHIQEDVNHLKTEFNGVKTDVSWLKKNQWYIITTSIGTLVSVLVGLVLIIGKLK